MTGKNSSPSTKQLREFGFTVGGAFTLLAGAVFLKKGAAAPTLAALGAALMLVGAIYPAGLAPWHKLWMRMAMALGEVMSRVILSALFILVVTPIALFLKLTGKDLLDRRFKKGERATYWMEHAQRQDKSSYERQF